MSTSYLRASGGEKCHEAYAKWLRTLIEGAEPFALSVLVAVGFVRIVTNRRIYEDPTPLPVALAFIEQMTTHPRCRRRYLPRHTSEKLCDSAELLQQPANGCRRAACSSRDIRRVHLGNTRR